MDVDVRPLPGLFEQTLRQISAADAFSTHEGLGMYALRVVAVGALKRYYEIANLVDGSKQQQ